MKSKETLNALSEEEMEQVSGGGTPWTTETRVCLKCGKEFSYRRFIGVYAPEPAECPDCRQGRTRRR